MTSKFFSRLPIPESRFPIPDALKHNKEKKIAAEIPSTAKSF
ncbi:hypothetical protein [Moorena sp. SIO4A5]|nr:hypothetical protein [Moorena sp. SIO4A5]